MFIRCKRCHNSVWVETSELKDGVATGSCRTCNQDYSVGGLSAKSSQDLATATRRLAQEQQIDLPGAYSVQLKVMNLDAVREVSPAIAAAAAIAELPQEEFDPAFQPSVEACLLTASEAARRGVRENFAKSMAKRFDIATDVAYALADNRISMVQALRSRGPSPGPAVRVEAPRRHAMSLALLLAAFALIAAAAGIKHWTARSPSTDSPDSASTPASESSPPQESH